MSDVAGYSGVTAEGAGYTGSVPVGYASAVATESIVFTEGHTFVAPRVDADGPLHKAYEHSWVIGPVTDSANSVIAMKAMRERPNEVFPFDIETDDGSPARIEPGVRLNLRRTTLWPFDDDHVRVTETSDTSFEFTTEDDHFRGAGTRVRFRTEESHRQVVLIQDAEETSSVLAPLYDWGARKAWETQARNLRALLYGGDEPAGFPWWK